MNVDNIIIIIIFIVVSTEILNKLSEYEKND